MQVRLAMKTNSWSTITVPITAFTTVTRSKDPECSISKAAKLREESAKFEENGELSQAEARYRVALDLLEQEKGPACADVASALNSLGDVLRRQRKFSEAEACAHRSAIIIEPLLPQFAGCDGILSLITSLVLLGSALRDQGRYQEAEAPLVRAVQIGRSLPSLTGALIKALNEYGVLCKFAGWFERADLVYRRAYELSVKFHGANSREVATVLHNQGGLCHAQAQFEIAEQYARKGLEMRRALLGDVHPEVLADAVAYAAILDGLGRYNESLPMYEWAIREYTRILGPESYEVAAALHNLSAADRALGKLADAEPLARRALDLKHKLLGTWHPDTAFSAMNLGAILLECGRRQDARALLWGAHVTFERTLAPDHPNLVQCRELLQVTDRSLTVTAQ